MKKSLALSLAVIGSLILGNAAQALPTSALSPSTEVAVVAAPNLIQPQAHPLAKGKSLVTWLEMGQQTFALKSKVVSATNSVGKVFAITPSPTGSSKVSGNFVPSVVSNAQGQFFAAWINEQTVSGVTSHKIMGRTSKDGLTWSSIFQITKPQQLTGGSECVENFLFPNCGFFELVAAIDGTGNLAVVVTGRGTDGLVQYSAVATKNTKSWPALKVLGTSIGFNGIVPNLVGLQTGFAVGYTNYNLNGPNSVHVSYFDAKTSSWTPTEMARSVEVNTVLYPKWVQRDSKTLSLVVSSEVDEGGIYVRNFDLTKKKFTSFGVVAVESSPDRVFQGVNVLAQGSNLVITYGEFIRSTSTGSTNVIMQSGLVGIFTKSIIIPHPFIDTLSFSLNKSNYPVLIYNVEGATRVAVLTGGREHSVVANSASGGYLNQLMVTKTNQAFGVGSQYDEEDGKTYLFLIKGQLN